MSESNNNDVYFQYIDATSIKILTANADIRDFVSNHFRYKDDAYSVYHKSNWDGYNRLYNKNSGKFPIGLWYEAYNLIKDKFPDSKIILDKNINLYKNISIDEIQSFVDGLIITKHVKSNNTYKRIRPYSHQVKGLWEYACHGRYTMESATSSGKSMMAYLITRYNRTVNKLNHQLFVVPTKSLVVQLKENFLEYSHDDNTFDASGLVQTVYENKEVEKPVMVSTWQSLHRLDKSYFSCFDYLFVDECHTADAKKLTKISNYCVNAMNRIGATGTLKDDVTSEMLVQSLFGYIINIIGSKELIDKGHATKLYINMVSLHYPEDVKIAYQEYIKDAKNKYQKEIEFIIDSHERSSWLCRFIDQLEGNTLVLFDRKDTHLYEDMEILKSFTDKEVHAISGSVKVKDRNYIKECLETKNDQVLYATFGTFQLGESVDNLHNLVVAHSTKSNVRIIQSIGRMMRMHENKMFSNIYDIVDILDPDEFNYVLGHSLPRLKYYIKEGHPVKLNNIYL